jgi:hypothetical protein
MWVLPVVLLPAFSGWGTQGLLIARETDCHSWYDAKIVTLGWMRPSQGRYQKPRVLCLQKRILQKSYFCSFCAASRRPLGPTVSSAIKGAEELSGRRQRAVVVSRRLKCASSASSVVSMGAFRDLQKENTLKHRRGDGATSPSPPVFHSQKVYPPLLEALESLLQGYEFDSAVVAQALNLDADEA